MPSWSVGAESQVRTQVDIDELFGKWENKPKCIIEITVYIDSEYVCVVLVGEREMLKRRTLQSG